MPVLYLVEQGSTLKKDGDTFRVTKDDKVLTTIPASKVEQVVIFGNIHITTPVIHHLLLEGIDCAFCSSTGRYHGRLFSTESRYGLLRFSQLQAASNIELRVKIARNMVIGKLANQRTMLMRYAREEKKPELLQAISTLADNVNKLENAQDIGTVMGLEGFSGALYFNVFKALLKQDLGFRARIKRPPRDPINSLLSFGYTLLVYDAQAAVRIVGMDPFIGFLHSTEYSKPSLALDIMEEFRSIIVDSIVLKVINNNIITREDFEKTTAPDGMVRLKQDTIKKFLGYYEERLQTTIIHPLLDIKATYRRCMELQVRQLARVITDKESKYKPFLVK